MKDFSNASFPPETLDIMKNAMGRGRRLITGAG
jgi:hypothetical protein